jgi:threonine synthase
VDALDFDIPLVEVEPGIYSLELFHGPTMAFKDVGARFMSRLMAYLHDGSIHAAVSSNADHDDRDPGVRSHRGDRPEIGNLGQAVGHSKATEKAESMAADRRDQRPLKVVVATSGDTGSAVAAGFHDVPGIEVYVLFPKGKVSPLQQKQITTWGGNICAIEVNGTFDDCQRLAKLVLGDEELNKQYLLTSANSINIARLIPQSIYYYYAVARLKTSGLPVVFSVPSGNFGNLTAGLLASATGLPVQQFIAATNVNDVIPEYTTSGLYRPRKSLQTISNAMDVGDPSNFARLMELFDNDHQRFCRSIYACAFTDEQTLAVIDKVYQKTGYLMDPHGAVAYMGARLYAATRNHSANMVFLETAHPAKFSGSIEAVVGKVPLPPQLQLVKDKQEYYVSMGNDVEALSKILHDRCSSFPS